MDIATVDLETWRRVSVRAVLLGHRIDLRSLFQGTSVSGVPPVIAAGERGAAVLFRFGAIVTFNVQPIEEAALLRDLRPFVSDPLDEPEREVAEFVVTEEEDERIEPSGLIRIRRPTTETLVAMADVLAKSVILAENESRVGRAFDRIDPVARALHRTSRRAVPAQELLDLISDVLLAQQHMVGRVEVSEKPDLLWDRPELDRLYVRMQEEYELPERHRSLSRKLQLIAQTASTALGLLQARRSLRVEWLIVTLILIEILLTLYELFIRHQG